MKINMTDLRLGIANDDLTIIAGVAADDDGDLALFVSTEENTVFFPMPETFVVQLHKVLDHYLHCDECKAARAVVHGVDAAKNSVN